MKTQRGIALVLVLWMVVLLAVIAGALGTTSRSGVAMITNLRQEHQARALVEAGLRFMMLQLAWRNLPAEDNPWPADGRLHPWDFAGQRIWIGAQPENARLGLNVVDEKQLGRLLQALGLPDEQAEALRDAILDWRDADDGRRPQGAEDDDYRAAGRPLGARDAPFAAVEELRQVLGMNDAIYARLAPMLTLYNGQRTVNPAFAPRELLLSAPGMDETLVDQYLAARDQARRQGEPVPPPPAAEERAPITVEEPAAPAAAEVRLWFRPVALGPLDALLADFSAELGRELPRAALLFLAARRALADLEVPLRPLKCRYRVGESENFAGFVAAWEAASEEGEGLSVDEAEPPILLKAPALVLATGGLPEEQGLLILAGELPTREEKFLERVAHYLEKPIRLLLFG